MLLDKKHIFVIEDNLQNRIIFQVILAHKAGARVLFEPWGNRAVLQLKLIPHIDVIILDLMLAGGISGYDVFDQIRAEPALAEIPILAVSAADPSSAIPKARQKGFAGFIAKPIDDVLFPEQVAAVIGGERVWHAGERAIH